MESKIHPIERNIIFHPPPFWCSMSIFRGVGHVFFANNYFGNFHCDQLFCSFGHTIKTTTTQPWRVFICCMWNMKVPRHLPNIGIPTKETAWIWSFYWKPWLEVPLKKRWCAGSSLTLSDDSLWNVSPYVFSHGFLNLQFGIKALFFGGWGLTVFCCVVYNCLASIVQVIERPCVNRVIKMDLSVLAHSD